MKQMIFENDYCSMSDDEIECALDNAASNLDITLDGIIYAVGTLVRWNGSFLAFKKVGSNISDCLLKTFDLGENDIKLYVENSKLMIEQRGHDNPVSPSVFEFRLFKNSDFDSEDEIEEMLYEPLVNGDIESIEKASEPIGDLASEALSFNAA